MQMRGTVRFRFRSPENDIDIIIEGESSVVESLRKELGLQGRVGFIQPLSARLVDGSELESKPAMGDDQDFSDVHGGEEKLPGPPPDRRQRRRTCRAQRLGGGRAARQPGQLAAWLQARHAVRVRVRVSRG